MNRREEDKTAELKKMLIGSWILKNRSDDDWEVYRSNNDDEWIQKEGMKILLTEEVVDFMVDKSDDEVSLIFNKFITTSSVSSSGVQYSLVRLCTSESDGMGSRWNWWDVLQFWLWIYWLIVYQVWQLKKWWNGHRVLQRKDWWNRHRLVCLVVGRIELSENEWRNETIDCVADYLVNVIDECYDLKMVNWAILAAECLWVKIKMKISMERRLRTALKRHSTLTHNDTLVKAIDQNGWDAEKYQVGWCVKWFEDNLLEGNMRKINPIKLSLNGFEARCDHFNYCPVRSSFPVKSNVYFYEVICLHDTVIQMGWDKRDTSIDPVSLQVNKNYSINVVGCLLDMNNKQFKFYRNGNPLECPTPQYFSPPYYATFYLSPRQQYHFNFGQSPFKYPPRNIRFTTFHEQSRGDKKKYRLVETEKYGDKYWFLHTPVDNQVSLFFDDEIQNKVNRKVRSLEEDIENGCDILWCRLKNLKSECHGYIQAIIEVMGKVCNGEKVDIMAQWIGNVIKDTVDKIDIPQLLELLYPYLQLKPTKSTITQHRSICIVVLHLIKCDRHYGYNIIKPIHSSVYTYLTSTLTSSPDHWTQLFVLIALTDLEMTEDEKKEVEGCEKIKQMVTWRNQCC